MNIYIFYIYILTLWGVWFFKIICIYIHIYCYRHVISVSVFHTFKLGRYLLNQYSHYTKYAVKTKTKWWIPISPLFRLPIMSWSVLVTLFTYLYNYFYSYLVYNKILVTLILGCFEICLVVFCRSWTNCLFHIRILYYNSILT